MCDTLVVSGEVAPDGVTIFGKNSDREPNEAQSLVRIPAQDHPSGSVVQCTYIEIPQVQHTHAVLLSKPFWMWGAEMGVNERGVAIGNEAIFAKYPYTKEDALLGMDLLRLGLERGASARQALEVITALLKEHGQGGNSGFQHKLYYHNSFILADPQDAWVLETAGPHWAAKQIRGIYTISNGLTIGNEFDLESPDLVSYAVGNGWCSSRKDFHFARCYSDFLYTRFSDCRKRCKRSSNLLSELIPNISVDGMMQVLRDHGEDANQDWSPDSGITGADICMHAGFGPVRGSQTVASMVSHLHPEHATHFFSATAAPCTSLFKPVWMDIEIPNMGSEPDGVYNSDTLFWRHEEFHRTTILEYASLAPIFSEERNEIESDFVSQALALAGESPSERDSFSKECFEKAAQAEASWLEQVRNARSGKGPRWLYKKAWDGFNRQAQMPTM